LTHCDIGLRNGIVIGIPLSLGIFAVQLFGVFGWRLF